MKKGNTFCILLLLTSIFWLSMIPSAKCQYPDPENDLDRQVISFLKDQSGQWRDMNISASDGRILYDLAMKGKYRKALEIGTSTGHSAIWIAWALSKNNGRLVTIEIDKKRYLQALSNFRKSGLSAYIDARLADAHDMVPGLEEGWDFVFCDAGKWWYKNYFISMEPKLVKGGCFVAHNTSMRSGDMRDFLSYIESIPSFTTRFIQESRSGISVSCKK